ncbi:unnamed protein product [Nezara viridula]|uniref:Uncharacterized protein n=1 Tax=Nezara viridula TaxID=85310 RepID=A0A9P0MUC0_NEZVI|nr:unnamed protein product [Nezara viridula]
MSDSDSYETAYESSPEAKFESKLNNRMHVMEGDMEKAGEGAPDLAQLLEDQSRADAKQALPIAEEHRNGIQKENETIEPVKEVQEEAPLPAPEIKEEIKEEETPAPKEVPVEEERPQSRPITPKEEEPQNSLPPPNPNPEASRKRALDVKEPEPEGGSGGEESDSSRKRNKVDQETETIPAEASNRETRTPVDDERERMISEFVTEVSTSPDSLGEASDRLAKEIESLGEMAATKEMEWNAILRVRKLKEEMLERLLRRKRMHCLDEQPVPERFPEHLNLNNKVPNNLMMMMMRGPRFPDGLGKQQRPILPKPSPYAVGINPREGRNGPIVDVKSIIDDYRSRHPETAPRRGRRMRGSAEQRFSSNPSLISMANMALGTGASVRTVSDHVYNMGMEQSRREEAAIKESVKPNGAKPYPEVTLHPVSPPSLLHQVLTKSTPPRPASFSPTLARLLTAPERPPAPPPHFRPPSRVSIADILSSTKQKNRNEITITPVSGTPPVAVKNKEDVVLLDDDDGDGGDRLVIDEGSEEVPQCQGCRHKSAQFVCAGCGNQWCQPGKNTRKCVRDETKLNVARRRAKKISLEL